MAALTIRNVDEALKIRLRVRAALRGRSMEEEARQILRAALTEVSSATPSDLGERIHQRFSALGDVRLPVVAREAVREPARLEDPSAAGAPRETSARAAPRKRRHG